MSKSLKTKVKKRPNNAKRLNTSLTNLNETEEVIVSSKNSTLAASKPPFEEKQMTDLLEPKKFGRIMFICWLDIIANENIVVVVVSLCLSLFGALLWPFFPGSSDAIFWLNLMWSVIIPVIYFAVCLASPIVSMFSSIKNNTTEDFLIKVKNGRGIEFFKQQILISEKLKQPNGVNTFKHVVDSFKEESFIWTQRLERVTLIVVAISAIVGAGVIKNDFLLHSLAITSSYLTLLCFYVGRANQKYLRELKYKLFKLEEATRVNQQ